MVGIESLLVIYIDEIEGDYNIFECFKE